MHRQVTAMTQAAIAANFGQPFDVHANLTTQITFNRIPVHSLAQLGHFGLR
jgi:hypothetical protein